jgi:hypothetical protein
MTDGDTGAQAHNNVILSIEAIEQVPVNDIILSVT